MLQTRQEISMAKLVELVEELLVRMERLEAHQDRIANMMQIHEMRWAVQEQRER